MSHTECRNLLCEIAEGVLSLQESLQNCKQLLWCAGSVACQTIAHERDSHNKTPKFHSLMVVLAALKCLTFQVEEISLFTWLLKWQITSDLLGGMSLSSELQSGLQCLAGWLLTLVLLICFKVAGPWPVSGLGRRCCRVFLYSAFVACFPLNCWTVSLGGGKSHVQHLNST